MDLQNEQIMLLTTGRLWAFEISPAPTLGSNFFVSSLKNFIRAVKIKIRKVRSRRLRLRNTEGFKPKTVLPSQPESRFQAQIRESSPAVNRLPSTIRHLKTKKTFIFKYGKNS